MASYAMKYGVPQTLSIDLKLVSNIISCLKDLHKLYKTTDWKSIQRLIPSEVKDVIRNVPNLWKRGQAIAKESHGMCLVSLYLVYQAMDIHDRAMSLQMDHNMYRKEFQWLQEELQPVLYVIHNDILPISGYLETERMSEITKEVIAKLNPFQTQLKQLFRIIHPDIKRAQSNKLWSAFIGFSSIPVFVTSLMFGNVPGAILSVIAGTISLFSHFVLDDTIRQLETLQNEVESACIEIQEYKFFLQENLTEAMILSTFHFLILLYLYTCILVYVTILSLLLFRLELTRRRGRDEYLRDKMELERKKSNWRKQTTPGLERIDD